MGPCWGLGRLRCSTVLLGIGNVAVIGVGGYVVFYALADCEHNRITAAFVLVSTTSLVRIMAMVQTGLSQRDTAQSVLDTSSISDSMTRLERRLKYKSWLWWCRFGMTVTVLQILCAMYVVYNVAKYITLSQISTHCFDASVGDHWKEEFLFLYAIIVCVLPMVQCFVGSDVLRWRSYYATHDDVWKTHYQEVFDNGIREALCCLGRIKYLSVSEEDEVHSVARLLGDLVSYRASGRGHLELLAGLTLLQKHREACSSPKNLAEAPKELIEDAYNFHKFAEAAYTGPLLDVGRHSVFFSCAWFYRQGLLTPWTRSRRPLLIGDNWWRGHAAAFLKYVTLSPESLRYGRVCQAKCEAAYFVVVLHDLKSLVIAVRGTETPEDLITDGLGRECNLTDEDLNHVVPIVGNADNLSFAHYGHCGIVEAARELYMQLEGASESHSTGILSSLLGPGCECDGYRVRIVGHSLGGAIATLLGLRLYHRYSNIHVYAFGPLPCLDFDLAEACSDFVTSIIHDKEFSARLSVGAIMRLQASAIRELVQDQRTDTTSVLRLARRFLYLNETRRESNDMHPRYLFHKSDSSNSMGNAGDSIFSNCLEAVDQLDDPISKVLEAVPDYEYDSTMAPPELYLPGRIIHLIPQRKSHANCLWKRLRGADSVPRYNAYLVNRENFREIVVSPKMFLDHLPWRCHCALRMALEAQNDMISQDQMDLV